MKYIQKAYIVLTAEFLVTWFGNSGTVVLTRSIWASLVLFVGGVYGSHLLSGTPNFRGDLSSRLQWFGPVLAAVYAILQTRYAAQWRYLSDVYNKIKDAEVRTAHTPSAKTKRYLDEWKASFIYNAFELHLVRKPGFALLISQWTSDDEVAKAFLDRTLGYEARLHDIRTMVAKTLDGLEYRAEPRSSVAPQAQSNGEREQSSSVPPEAPRSGALGDLPVPEQMNGFAPADDAAPSTTPRRVS